MNANIVYAIERFTGRKVRKFETLKNDDPELDGAMFEEGEVFVITFGDTFPTLLRRVGTRSFYETWLPKNLFNSKCLLWNEEEKLKIIRKTFYQRQLEKKTVVVEFEDDD